MKLKGRYRQKKGYSKKARNQIKIQKKESTGKNRGQVQDSSLVEAESLCLVCVRPFGNSLQGETWLQFIICKGWAGNSVNVCQNCKSDYYICQSKNKTKQENKNKKTMLCWMINACLWIRWPASFLRFHLGLVGPCLPSRHCQPKSDV